MKLGLKACPDHVLVLSAWAGYLPQPSIFTRILPSPLLRRPSGWQEVLFGPNFPVKGHYFLLRLCMQSEGLLDLPHVPLIFLIISSHLTCVVDLCGCGGFWLALEIVAVCNNSFFSIISLTVSSLYVSTTSLTVSSLFILSRKGPSRTRVKRSTPPQPGPTSNHRFHLRRRLEGNRNDGGHGGGQRVKVLLPAASAVDTSPSWIRGTRKFMRGRTGGRSFL